MTPEAFLYTSTRHKISIVYISIECSIENMHYIQYTNMSFIRIKNFYNIDTNFINPGQVPVILHYPTFCEISPVAVL